MNYESDLDESLNDITPQTRPSATLNQLKRAVRVVLETTRTSDPSAAQTSDKPIFVEDTSAKID